MYTCIQLATYRNTFYHIKIINRCYPSTHSRSISVVVNLVYNKVAETKIIFALVTPTTHTPTFNVMVTLVTPTTHTRTFNVMVALVLE